MCRESKEARKNWCCLWRNSQDNQRKLYLAETEMRSLSMWKRVKYGNIKGNLSAWVISCVIYCQEGKNIYDYCAIHSSRIKMGALSFKQGTVTMASNLLFLCALCELESATDDSTFAGN